MLFSAMPEVMNAKQQLRLQQKKIVVIVAILIIGVGDYLLGIRSNKQSQIGNKFAPTNLRHADQNVNWKTYTNETYHYSLSYPTNWILNTMQADPNPNSYEGTQITLTSPDGDVMTFEYNIASGAVPLHIYKSVPVTLVGQPFIKTYNDGCGFNTSNYSNGMETPSYYDCVHSSLTDRGIFQITYGLGKDIENNTIPEYTTIYGRDASLRFKLKKHIPLGMENTTNFQQKDAILNKIISSLTFTS